MQWCLAWNSLLAKDPMLGPFDEESESHHGIERIFLILKKDSPRYDAEVVKAASCRKCDGNARSSTTCALE